MTRSSAAKKGDIIDPLKGALGFVILRVDERYEAGQATFEEVQDDIQDRMARPRMEPKIREYLTKLRQEAFLEIKEGYVDSRPGARQGYALARRGAVEAADHHQGRSGRAHQAAQAVYEPGADSRNREADRGRRRTRCASGRASRPVHAGAAGGARTPEATPRPSNNEISLRKRARAEQGHHHQLPGSLQGNPPEEGRRILSFAAAGRPHRRTRRQDVGQRGRGDRQLSTATISSRSKG